MVGRPPHVGGPTEAWSPMATVQPSSLATPSTPCDVATEVLASAQSGHFSKLLPISPGSCTARRHRRPPRASRHPPTAAPRTPYQFTVRAASLSAMSGRSPLASHTARQTHRRQWGMATRRPGPLAGTGHGPDPRPPGATARHPAPPGPGEHRWRRCHPSPSEPALAATRGASPVPSRGRDVPKFCPERLNPEILVAAAASGRGRRHRLRPGIRRTQI